MRSVARTPPSKPKLLEFARRFARELHGIEPPEVELEARIEYVVWGRKQAWELLEDGLITELELRQLLIDHLDYECAHISGHAWPEYDAAARARMLEALDDALYGRPAAGGRL